jgi:hypothetical protein
MSSSDPQAFTEPRALPDLSDRELQTLLASVVKAYAQRQQDAEPFPALAPDAADDLVAGTDAGNFASALLEATSLEIFELGMWKTWGTVA